MTASAPVIAVDNLSFGFGRKEVLSGVSFSVEDGERFSIIGPNGAGKSTLLKLINRAFKGGTGSVTVRGKPLRSYSQKALARIIGYVPQQEAITFPYTVREFVMMGRYPHLSPFTSFTKEDEKAALEAVALAGAEAFTERRVNSLSGGERQKVFIAAALAQGASALLLDEPTTFLDPKSEDEILKTLERVNKEKGVTVVSVTHDINNAALRSDRVMAINNGRVAFIGAPRDLMRNDVLRRVYGKDFLFVNHPRTGRPMIAPDVEEARA